MYSDACHSLSLSSHCSVGNLKAQTLAFTVSTWPHITFFPHRRKVDTWRINQWSACPEKVFTKAFWALWKRALSKIFLNFLPPPCRKIPSEAELWKLRIFLNLLIKKICKYAVPIKFRPPLYIMYLYVSSMINMCHLSNASLFRIQNHLQGKVHFISENACINSGALKY